MSIYEKNLECIEKHRDYMYNLLKDFNMSEASNRLEEVKSVDTKDKEKALIIKHNSTQYRLNSLYRPLDEADRWASQFDFQNIDNLITIFGLGNGTFVRTIMDKMGPNGILVIYEPCADIFQHVMENYDISDILTNNRISITVEKINDFEFHNTLRGVINIKNISNQIMCVHPQYDKIFPESCVFFWKELKDSYYSARLNINTEIFFGKRFIDNILKNIKYLADTCMLSELKELLPKDVPAMIVAAGPSVGRQIEELKRAKGRAVIFAVDRILEFLLDEGVEPDFVVSLDPKKPVKYFPNRPECNVPLICFQESNYEIMDIHYGKKIICNCSTFLRELYQKLGKVPPKTSSSASVATLTFSVCVELGFKDIILVGQDLAYDGERSHAGNKEEHYGTTKDLMLEGVDGKMIRSRYDWKEFVVWYQDMLTLLPDINVIDAKEKGAKIKGTTVMPLREALSSYCKQSFDFSRRQLEERKTFNREDLIKVREYLSSSLVALGKIVRRAKQSIKSCDLLIENCNSNSLSDVEIQDLIKKLGRNNKYIEKQPIYLLMDKFVIASSAQYLMEINRLTDDYMKNNLNTYEKAKSIFQAVIDAAEYIKPTLEEAIEQVMPTND